MLTSSTSCLKCDSPAHPPGYRAIYSRDGRSVVIKNVDAAGRAGQISNPLGPAILSVDSGPKWYIDGVELSEDEWRRSAGEDYLGG
jgi:hypothetical protein